MALRRIVIVGLGSIGRRHARLLKARGDLAVELCEVNAETLRAAQEQLGGLPEHRSFDAMLATRPEMVLIATPHRFHADQTIAALQAGIHVLCEKPMSDTLANAQRMHAAAQQSRAVLAIGFMLHFHPALRRVKEMVDAGALGRLLHVRCHVGTYITLVSSVSRHQAAVEGALLLDYAHQPDLLYWLLGQSPRTVFMAAATSGRFELSSNPNFADLTLEYDDPFLATIHLNYAQAPERAEYELVGDEGWAILDVNSRLLRLGRRRDNTETRETLEYERDPMYVAEHEAFLDAVDGRRPPETSAADGLVSMRVIDAALRSWRTHAPAPLASDANP